MSRIKLLLVCAPALAMAAMASGDRAGPPARDPVRVTFSFEDGDRVYGCSVSTSLPGSAVLPGAVRSSASERGARRVTIDAGTYGLSLGVHQRSRAPAHPTLSPALFRKTQRSRVMGDALRRAFRAAYRKDGDRYVLGIRAGHDAYWKTRLALAAWDARNDRIRIEPRPGRARLALVLAADGAVPVTYPTSTGRRRRDATLVHVHSGPNGRRGARGCLTVPQDQWKRFLAPFVRRFPKLDDWVAYGGVGKRIGVIEVRASRR